jgi:hypothetical protein
MELTPPAAGALPASDPAVEAEAPEGQGYVIEIVVKGDGSFAVSKEPLQAEAVEENAEPMPGAAQDQTFSSLGEMLKGVMAIVQENPVSGNEQTQFDAGFGGGSPMAKKY